MGMVQCTGLLYFDQVILNQTFVLLSSQAVQLQWSGRSVLSHKMCLLKAHCWSALLRNFLQVFWTESSVPDRKALSFRKTIP